jgi:AraC-like DNA-binding protein/catechol 2,3-dioxygenase-like lactoylglutathione lyase family enzyme
MLRARDAIDRDYAQPLDITALAALAAVSEAHFIRTFRSVFGETPHRYLQRRRVERAMSLLRTTDRSVTDVCMAVGFTSLGTFSRTFRAVVGQSPSEFRRNGSAPPVPTCFTMAWMRPSSFGEARGRRPLRLTPMFKQITHSSLYVLDQDEALDFYVAKLGFEVRSDVDLGFMRWLTIGVPGDTGREVLLEVAGPPSLSDDAAAEVRDLLTRGALGLGFILSVDDCHQAHRELSKLGVEFTQEPVEQPYGIDCGIRDPFGNHIRITQPAEEMGEITDKVKAEWESAGPEPARRG